MVNQYIKNSFKMLIVILLITTSVLALGVNIPYELPDNPLIMYPGQSQTIDLVSVHSSAEQESAKATLILIDNQNIAETASRTTFTIAPGGRETSKIKITIPIDAQYGTTYIIKLSLQSGSEDESGNVQLSKAYDINIPVIITSQDQVQQQIIKIAPVKSSSSYIITIIFAIIIAILLIVWLLKRRINLR